MRDRVYLHTKKGGFLFLILSFITIPLFAQEKTEVLLKFSKQEELTRIVFESEEPFLNRTKATFSPSQITVEFPGPFNLTTKKEPPFDLVLQEKSLLIHLEEKGKIRFFRLSSPSRLVFDIQTGRYHLESIPFDVFALDAGHGGYDFGITFGKTKEKDITLSLAKDLRAILSKRGKKVYLTRTVDLYMPLIQRIKSVNQRSPDVFISFHSSLSDNFVLYTAKFEDRDTDKIIDLYHLSSRQKRYIEKSRALSESIGEAIKDEFETNVIYREMPLPLLNSARAPSIVIESPSPKTVDYDQQMKARVINAILRGLAAYGQ